MQRTLGRTKRVALVAHDNKKDDLLGWARFNRHVLAAHEVLATRTTGECWTEISG